MARVIGFVSWSGSEDEYQYRTFKLVQRVEVSVSEGPEAAMDAEGVPQPGAVWAFDGEANTWCWLRTKDVKPVQTADKLPMVQFLVESVFSNKPPTENKQRCNDTKIEDPLLEPPRISISTTNEKEEATYDRFGFPVVNSAWEQFRGPQVEFDKSNLRVKIVQNVPVHNLALLSAMRDTVNGNILWGCLPRTIKLSSISMERKFFGLCEVYWERTLEFEIRAETWDRFLLDEGTKALNGHHDPATGDWILDNIDGETPDSNNPLHFKRYKDRDGENCRVVLNGYGVPAKLGGPIVQVDPRAIPNLAFVYNVGDVVTHGGNQYMALQRNSNVEPVDVGPIFSTIWVKLIDPIPPTDNWNDTTDYARGNLVRIVFIEGPPFTLLAYFVALKASGPSTLPREPGDPDFPGFWQEIPLPGGVDLGDWVGAPGSNPYTPVGADGQVAGIGEIPVSKYGESDFLLLGIPTVF